MHPQMPYTKLHGHASNTLPPEDFRTRNRPRAVFVVATAGDESTEVLPAFYVFLTTRHTRYKRCSNKDSCIRLSEPNAVRNLRYPDWYTMILQSSHATGGRIIKRSFLCRAPNHRARSGGASQPQGDWGCHSTFLVVRRRVQSAEQYYHRGSSIRCLCQMERRGRV